MSSPLHPRDMNAPTPTKWLSSFAYVPNSTPIRIAVPPPHCTPDSHTKRVAELEHKIEVVMESLMRPANVTPDSQVVSPQHHDPNDSTLDEPLVAVKIEEDVTPKPQVVGAVPEHHAPDDTKLDEPLVAVKIEVDAVVVKVEEGTADLKEGHKVLYARAKEQLELLAHGGLQVLGSGASGTVSKTCSGSRYNLVCHHRKTAKCEAKGFINGDFSVEFVKDHNSPTPHPTVPHMYLPGTGCPRYGKFRGLHASEVEVATAHDTKAARTTNAKDMSLKILAQKVTHKASIKPEPTDVQTEDDVELPNAFDKPPPSRRALRHFIHAHKNVERVDVSEIGSCQQHVEKHWEDKMKRETNQLPCEVRVVHTEQWESAPVAAKLEPSHDPPSRKTRKTATATAPDTADVPHAGKRKAPLPVSTHNSIVIISTLVLMALCQSSCDAGIDGTYRCAPARSTIADFGVFSGRSYVPCFLGILTGPRSGDTSEHWGRFLAAVRRLLNDWCPKSCVKDHAACLINALNVVFGACQQIVCYFHLRQCIRRRKSKMPALAARYKEIMRLIDVLHYTIEENWALASQVLDRKLPSAFKAHFFEKTGHGDGGANEIWTHRDLAPGQCATNCAAEMFHHTLRTDPDHFNGIMKPGYMTCMGLLGNTIGMISFQCSHPSSVGRFHYTEHGDTVALTRLRATWKAGIALCESKILEKTYNVRGLVFYFLKGGEAVSRKQVETLQANKGNGPSEYLKFHSLRRVSETECKACVPFLKFGMCRHVFAVQFHVHGNKFVPHGVLRSTTPNAPDRDSDVDSEVDAADGREGESETESDPEDAEDEVVAASTTQRSRRPAHVHNAASF